MGIDLRRFDHRHSDSAPLAASLDNDQHSRYEQPPEASPQSPATASPRTGEGGGCVPFLSLMLRCTRNAKNKRHVAQSVRGQGPAIVSFTRGYISKSATRFSLSDLTVLKSSNHRLRSKL